jgi:hypothetical protein
MPRIPSDREMTLAAEQLGLIQPGETVPPRLRAKVARAIQLADDAREAEHAEDDPAGDFVSPIASTFADLIKAGLSEDAAARVVAAIAPSVWRTTKGAAQ